MPDFCCGRQNENHIVSRDGYSELNMSIPIFLLIKAIFIVFGITLQLQRLFCTWPSKAVPSE